jgi:mRNA interferase HicA
VHQPSESKNLLHARTFSSDNGGVTGNEFIRKLKAYGKKQGVAVTLNASRGKGSHQTLYFGSAFTIVRNPKDELKTGTFHGMCSQLGVKPNDL